ncbi:MAG: peroxiredoxin [Methylobacter sp.]|nr:MAG: peroxiredoxin [Methylobacter sp.]PPD19809.1 MAG: peroxiredoxin [Methylobacter sp.]PPD37384.1 MAG: peroxiredoxin [Methylomonas sp.]
MLENNQEAPFFRAVNQDNQLIYLSDYLQKKNVVVYFYPKDDTPGCTIEANEFTTLAPAFTELDTVILGVSKDSCESHRAFIKKFDLTIQLLADTEGTLCELFDVWQEVEKDGVKKFKVVRSTFIIDKQGQIREALYNVSPEGHAQAVLEKINEISQQTNTA